MFFPHYESWPHPSPTLLIPRFVHEYSFSQRTLGSVLESEERSRASGISKIVSTPRCAEAPEGTRLTYHHLGCWMFGTLELRLELRTSSRRDLMSSVLSFSYATVRGIVVLLMCLPYSDIASHRLTCVTSRDGSTTPSPRYV